MLLMLAGLLGIDRSEDLAAGSGQFARQQLVWAGLALGAIILTALPDYRRLAPWSYAIFGLGLVLLMAVYWFPPVNGAQRWFRAGPASFQPSEPIKVAFILALARHLAWRPSAGWFGWLAIALLVALLPMLLILREPDLGTSLVFAPVLVAMLYVAGTRLAHLAMVACCAAALMPVLWSQMSHEQRSRVASLFEQTAPGQRPAADGYQLHQSKQLIALGGVLGSYCSGEPSDDRTAYHLPESHTDFVFSVLGERYGWPGMALVLAMFALVAWRSIAIAEATREPFGRLIATGVAALFVTEAAINTGMTTGLLPVTGLSLPLVSYGGSGMLAHAAAIGLVASVAMHPGYEVAPAPFSRLACPPR